jgi:hypothetical protein
MKAIDRHLGEVPEVAIQVFKILWHGERVPDNLTLLAQWLKDAGERFGEWRCSSARAGVDTALRVACSWYEDLDLDALHSLRGDAPTDMDPAKTAKRCDRAYRVAQFASTSRFIPPPSDIEDLRMRSYPPLESFQPEWLACLSAAFATTVNLCPSSTKVTFRVPKGIGSIFGSGRS